jgi:hypothetical protein
MKKMREIPFDLAAMTQSGMVSEGFWWPISPPETAEFLDRQYRSFLSVVSSLEGMNKDVVLLAASRILGPVRAIADTAIAVSRLQERNAKFLGSAAPLHYLQDGQGDLDFVPEVLRNLGTLPKSMALRAMAHTLRLNGLRSVQAMTDFDTVIVSRNPLLEDELRRSHQAIRFNYGDLILARAVDSSQPPDRSGPPLEKACESLVEHLVEALSGFTDEIANDIRARMVDLIRARVRSEIIKAFQTMSALRRFNGLPSSIWSGSGGNYAARAIGLEVIRRNGTVRRFDHGGSTGLMGPHAAVSLVELSVSTHFVCPSGKVAAVLSRQEANTKQRLVSHHVEVESGQGFPGYKEARSYDYSCKRHRTNILYSPTVFTGLNRHIPPIPSDAIYLYWQLRLATFLGSHDSNLLCKPHPEGVLNNSTHPLEQVAECAYGRFEEYMEEADIFIFDYPRSTTFWKALCTQRRVILLDFGTFPVTADALMPFKGRVEVVPVAYDDANLPIVPQGELQEILMRPLEEKDPSWFIDAFSSGV